MERPLATREDGTPPESRRFYSRDPYEVLGVKKTATKEEISEAYATLQETFSPDTDVVNTDLRTSEISEKIDAAYAQLTKEEQQGVAVSPEQETTETVNAEMLSAVEKGAGKFKEYVRKARKEGVSAEQIDEWVKTPEVQEVLQDDFVSKVKEYKDAGAERVMAYAAKWEKAGVDMSAFVHLPEVVSFLEERAIDNKIKLYGKNDAKAFLKFVESWKKADVDLSSVVETEEVKKFLREHTIQYKIKRFGTHNPKIFLAFVREWKKAEVDLSELVNDEESQVFLERTANAKGKAKPTLFKPYVESWMQAGWKPSQEIMEALENT